MELGFNTNGGSGRIVNFKYFSLTVIFMSRVSLVSSDLNGTLVHQHTMSHMIELFIGQKEYEAAKKVFDKQTSGEASIEEAFANAGPLTRGLTLRDAIEYTTGGQMQFVDGFEWFTESLARERIPLVINSTGYSVTIYAIREQIGADKIHGQIGNFLRFAPDADPGAILREDELERLVKAYFQDSGNRLYDKIQATGDIELGISDESAKSRLIQEYARDHFKGLGPSRIMHIGDTMGDSRGILDIAKLRGVGVAFNYNQALGNFLTSALREGSVSGDIYFIDPKSENSNLTKVLSKV